MKKNNQKNTSCHYLSKIKIIISPQKLLTPKKIPAMDLEEKRLKQLKEIEREVEADIEKLTKKRDYDEWNRLDDLYDEHYPPGFDPF